MRDGKQLKFKKKRMLHGIWLPAIVILAEAFFVSVSLHANAVRCMDEIEQKEDMLSLAMDIRERRDVEINEMYWRRYPSSVDVNRIYCGVESIVISGAVYTDVLKEYTGMEVYRAEAAENGGYGDFRRVGDTYPTEDKFFFPVVPDIIPDGVPKESPKRYNYIYTDSGVEPGKKYAYRIYANGRRVDGKPAPKLSSVVETAFTGSTQGKYTCSVVENTKKKLIVKLAGGSEETGLLKCRIGCVWSAAYLLYKDELYGTENIRKLQIIKYSYDGKTWHDNSYAIDGSYAMFSICGKESVYLWLVDDPHWDAYNRWKKNLEDIDFSGYRYAQMLLPDIFYNASGNHITELRFNLISGRALTGNFTQWNDITNGWETEWESGIFRFYANNYRNGIGFYDDYESYE